MRRKRTPAELAADKRRSETLKRRKARDRERTKVSRRALRSLPKTIRTGTYPTWARPLVDDMDHEVEALVQALGGPESVSEQRLSLLADAALAGVVLRAEFARYIQSREPDAATRVGTLASVRARILSAVGLDRVEREVQDLDAYLRQEPQPDASEPIPTEDAKQDLGSAPIDLTSVPRDLPDPLNPREAASRNRPNSRRPGGDRQREQ